jgi:pheromone shutdown protein TraB
MPFPFLAVGSIVGNIVGSVIGKDDEKGNIDAYIQQQNEQQQLAILEQEKTQKRDIKLATYFGIGLLFLIIILIVNKYL